jgi:hypothetical protein
MAALRRVSPAPVEAGATTRVVPAGRISLDAATRTHPAVTTLARARSVGPQGCEPILEARSVAFGGVYGPAGHQRGRLLRMLVGRLAEGKGSAIVAFRGFTPISLTVS